jgi:soluble lytic murein transglycosylase
LDRVGRNAEQASQKLAGFCRSSFAERSRVCQIPGRVVHKHITAGSLVLAWAFSGTAFAHLDPLMCAVVVPDQREDDRREEAVRRDGPHEEAVCLPPLPAPRKAEPPAWSEPLSAEEARASLDEADAALARGELGDALLNLRVVELGAPRIADRIALQRGDVLLALGQPELACEAYALAASSPSRDVAVRGHVGKVRCLLEAGDRDGDTALQDLLRRYPLLSERSELQYLLARARAGWGSLHAAATLLRAIDLNEPESAVAEHARVELERLRALGVRPVAFTPEERVSRAERLLARGPLDAAEAELRELAADPRIKGELAARAHLLMAKLMRVQGRFDALRDELARARNAGAPGPDALRLSVTNAVAPAEPAPGEPPATDPRTAEPQPTLTPTGSATIAMPALELSPEEQAAQLDYTRRVRSIRGSKVLAKLQTPQLRLLFDLALGRGDRELLDEVMAPLAARKGVMAGMRFDFAMRASAVASDASVLKMLETLLPIPAMHVPALYHHARTLERMGRVADAEAELRRVIAGDRSETRYYAMWAQQRLSKLEPSLPVDQAALMRAGDSDGAAAAEPAPAAVAAPVAAPVAQDGVPPSRATLRADAVARLRPIVERHGEAYPWLARALDLIELDRFEAAADELSETYMAYRDAIGAPRLRAGLYAVYTDDAPPRRPADFATRKARIALKGSAQAVLREVATQIGDPGIALRFGSWSPTARPRAYASIVEAAAKKHGVDPNLLFAVMRVESIYNRRIVSYAGAVGLMQIMPTTGRRIALELGQPKYSVSDLLDPTTNVQMAAWYLGSLIERFDGRLPLAIASYNGGPHNVRVWMSQHHPSTPLDAFLERIPFSQTHRYVRRVLTHYAAYRAQKDLPMRELSVELPALRADQLAF